MIKLTSIFDPLDEMDVKAKSKLDELFEKYGNTQVAGEIKLRPRLYSHLQSKTSQFDCKNIIEMAYIFYYGYPECCQYGNKPIFNSWENGYRQFCGKHSNCKCLAEHQSKVIHEYNERNLTKEVIQQRQEKTRQTNLEKHGVDCVLNSEIIKEQIKQTNLEKYGAETPFESAIIVDKIKQTNVEKYGVEFPFQSEEIRSKALKTSKERYGEDNMWMAREAYYLYTGYKNPFSNPEVIQKIKKHYFDLYGKNHVKQKHLDSDVYDILHNEEKFKSIISGKYLEQIADELQVSPGTVARSINFYNCENLLGKVQRSLWEIKIGEVLDKYNISYIQSSRKIIPPKEIDIYIPEYNVAIEINGLYWHSELSQGRGRYYHYDKFISCKDKGIHLYQFYDDELKNSYDIIISKILYLCKKHQHNHIGARKIKDISKLTNFTDEVKFLNDNHIQGRASNRNVSIGAFYEGNLVGVLTGYNKNNIFNLTRYSTKKDYIFSGLFSKMLKYFINEYSFKGVIQTFSDNRHSNGNLYLQSGFYIAGHVPPTYFYTHDYHERYYPISFRKEKIEKIFNIDITDKTEWQAMQELGYDRIWDAGKIKWIKEVK